MLGKCRLPTVSHRPLFRVIMTRPPTAYAHWLGSPPPRPKASCRLRSCTCGKVPPHQALLEDQHDAVPKQLGVRLSSGTLCHKYGTPTSRHTESTRAQPLPAARTRRSGKRLRGHGCARALLQHLPPSRQTGCPRRGAKAAPTARIVRIVMIKLCQKGGARAQALRVRPTAVKDHRSQPMTPRLKRTQGEGEIKSGRPGRT